jgi:hypothetical protein
MDTPTVIETHLTPMPTTTLPDIPAEQLERINTDAHRFSVPSDARKSHPAGNPRSWILGGRVD